MKRAALALLVTLAACGEASPNDAVPMLRDPAPQSEARAPVILTAENLGGMEAIAAGTLRRIGPCLYLEGGVEPQLIVWGGKVRIEEDGAGWLLRLPSGKTAREGDFVKGGGGGLPVHRPISDFTAEPVPEACATGAAVQLHSVEEVRPLPPRDPTLPDPPPPPPNLPDFLDSVRASGLEGLGEVTIIENVASPREALFAHVIAQTRADTRSRKTALCIRQVSPDLLARLQARFDDIHPAPLCRWDDGGVRLRRDDRPAAFVDARIDCDGRRNCAAEGAVTWGNVGGEGYGYVTRPVSGGWSVQRTNLSWMS